MLYIPIYGVILFTAQVFFLTSHPSSWWLLIVWGILAFLVFLFRYRTQLPGSHPYAYEQRRMLLVIYFILFFLIASHVYLQLFLQQHRASPLAEQLSAFDLGDSEQIEQEEFNITGRIHSMIETDGNRVRFELLLHLPQPRTQSQRSLSKSRSEKVQVTRFAETELELQRLLDTLQRGDHWQGTVSFSRPTSARNPGAFDYRQYLYRQGIQWTATVTQADWQVESKGIERFLLSRWLDRQHAAWMQQVDELFQPQISALVKAMTLGYRSDIDDNLLTVYQELGLIHLLAISGLHVGIVLWLLHAVLFRLPLTRETIYTILMLFVPLYMYVTGFQVSAVRAGLMAMVVLVALRYRLLHHALLGLMIVYVLTLLAQPFNLYHIGYQLSFGITCALITVLPALEKRWTAQSFLKNWPSWCRMSLIIALLAQVVSLPIILYFFYQFSPLSLVLNLFFVPVYSFVLIPGAFVLPLLSMLFAHQLMWLVWLYENMFEIIHALIAFVHRYSWATIYTGQPSALWLWLYVFIMLCWFWSAEKKGHRLFRLSLLLLPLLVGGQLLLPYLDQRAHITVLDVGQAEAIVVELPFREGVMLIDAGDAVRFNRPSWQQRRRTYDSGSQVILPYLRFRGVNHVDQVVLTHAHYDHYAGLPALLGRITIGEVYRSPVVPQNESEVHLIEQLRARNIPIYIPPQGMNWATKHSATFVLWPATTEALITRPENVHDYNIVLWQQIYGTTLVWTGDVENAGESSILKKYDLAPVDILKIAHHGSQTSSSVAWLHALQPSHSIISAPQNSPYGHPHTDVIGRLNAIDSSVWQTGLHGGIYIVIEPGGIAIRPTQSE